MEWKVAPEESGLKLLSFLREKLGCKISARQLKQALNSGGCRINGRVERFASSLVGRGDSVVLEMPLELKSKTLPLDLSDNIIFIDEDIICINKPPGISSEDKTFLDRIICNFGHAILLHRLDRETSGVLLFARNKKCAESILELFKERKIDKTYLALVDGVPHTRSGEVENYLGKLHSYEGQSLWGTVSREKGAYAYTGWKIKSAGREVALLECKPATGRTHQIRVHLSGLGLPILGDYQYGRRFHCLYRPQRLMLHAWKVEFVHPKSLKAVSMTAPIPEDFRKAVEELIGKE